MNTFQTACVICACWMLLGFVVAALSDPRLPHSRFQKFAVAGLVPLSLLATGLTFICVWLFVAPDEKR